MLTHKGSQQIETNRLLLRKITNKDCYHMFHGWANDKEVTKYLSWESHKTIDETRLVVDRWINNYSDDDYYHWVIDVKDLGRAVGTISVIDIQEESESCQIGYCISKDMWGHGFTTEAFDAVIKYLFNEIGIERIEAHHYIKNSASGIVMKNAGLKYEGRLRSFNVDRDGTSLDCDLYAIHKKDQK